MNLTKSALPLALVLTAALSGCGGSGSSSSGASPKTWTSALCGGLGKLKDDEASLEKTFTAQAAKVVSDPAGSKKAFADAIDTVRADFTESITALKKAGKPNVKNGATIQTQILAALTKGEQLFVDARDGLTAAPNNATALATALTTVGTKLQSGGTSLEDAFNGLDKADTSGALDKAATSNKDCDSISNG